MAPADLRRVAEIHIAAWRHAYAGVLPAERLAALDLDEQTELWESALFHRPFRTNLILEDDGAIHGWCAIGPARDDDEDDHHTGEIYGVHVHPASHRRGHGTTLLAHAHQSFRDRAWRESILWVVEANATARSFYEHRRDTLEPGARKTTDWLCVPEVRYRRPL
jgi:ribosomal protein S18 acetylase RimI-like enzyme